MLNAGEDESAVLQALEVIRSDNGPEFVATNIRAWLKRGGVKALYIEPRSPWENGYSQSEKRTAASSSAISIRRLPEGAHVLPASGIRSNR